VRTLLILLKRQLIDDAVYFVAALVLSIILTLGITIAVLSDEPTHPSAYTIWLFVALAIFVTAGPCGLAILQAYFDRISGVEEWLRESPVTDGQRLAARMTVGGAIILTGLAPLVVAGVLLWEFLGPPDWLVEDWYADVFSGAALLALASYCMGTQAGARATTFARTLPVLAWTPMLVVLMVIKGFGWPLAVVLVAFMAAELLRLRNRNAWGAGGTLATGLIVVVFFAVFLSAERFVFDAQLADGIDGQEVEIGAVALPTPNSDIAQVSAHARSRVAAGNLLHSLCWRMHRGVGRLFPWVEQDMQLTEQLGVLACTRARKRGRLYETMCCPRWRSAPLHAVHAGQEDGRLVLRQTIKRGESQENDWTGTEVLYAGPHGVSPVQAEGLGRFVSPVFGYVEIWGRASFEPRTFIVVYDPRCRRFLRIDIDEQTMDRGPQLQVDCAPVTIGSVLQDGRLEIGVTTTDTREDSGSGPASQVLVAVVNESGRVDLLDLNTLQVVGTCGTLPALGHMRGQHVARPSDLLDADVRLLVLPSDRGSRSGLWSPSGQVAALSSRQRYVGMAAAALSPRGTCLSLAVFDEHGKEVKTEHATSRMLASPWLVVPTTAKFAIESLHPPVLALASFFTAYHFDAGASHRAIFLMPNSFVALQRDRRTHPVFQFLLALLFMVPGLSLAGLLGKWVVKDARVIGLSPRARRLWFLGTLAFGLPAYITYRRVRPKTILTHCRNCGRLRRSDRDRCHHCGSPWATPSLDPPPWHLTDVSGQST